MKFIVNSAYLLKQLSNINGVITTNPVVPILENFLFELEKGGLDCNGLRSSDFHDH
jgi:DNA polymerase-3 subunit beta